jgi:carbon-monoxide dehydrogenase small subunit
MKIGVTVNGEAGPADVEPPLHLGDFLREHLSLTGTHLGCEHGVYGACTVRIDGVLARACLVLAAQAEGWRVETIEGLSDSGEIADLQAAFHERNPLQCGYCTPGMLIVAQDLLLRLPIPIGLATIRERLTGNYCRYTGYHPIVEHGSDDGGTA